MAEYPAAIDRPGPDGKRWPDNSKVGAILHSMEGYAGGAWSVLDGDSPASWHFSVMQDGTVYQHYPVEASPWHAGGKAGNLAYVGIEHEGVAGEPLTVAQRTASVDLVRWLAARCGWLLSREPGARTLWEHNEVGATTCPNGRIPWEFYALVEQEEPVQVRALDPQETIDAAEAMFRRFSNIMHDDPGETMVEVIDPPTDPGYRTIQIRYRTGG